jgi:DNA (cytosine-5)-methyltransferase 1
MKDKLKVLDLFCCEGGAGYGYYLAGFEVTGVDLNPKYSKNYPFEFHVADAIKFLEENYQNFDLIHASPPCQAYSVTKNSHNKEHPKLIEATREALLKTGKPYILENVVGAPLLNPVTLCGTMFGLEAIDTDGTPLVLYRHRLFESNLSLTAPEHAKHKRGVQVAGSYGGARRDKYEAKNIRKGGYVPAKEIQEKLLGINWASEYGLWQSIPPAYTQHLGQQVKEILENE